MKVIRLSGRQTGVLEAMGVDLLECDVLIPSHRGPGTFTYCPHCYHSRTEDGYSVCGNPNVEHGLQGCFFVAK